MDPKSRMLGGVLLTCVIAGALWLFVGDGGNGKAAPPIGQPPTIAATGTSSPASSNVPATTDTKNAAPATSERTEVAVPDTKNATLCGRCVDPAGVPLAGCVVSLHGQASDATRVDSWLVDHDVEPEWTDPPALTTRGDGGFSFTFWPPPPWQFEIEVTHDGSGAMSGRWDSLAEGSKTDVGDVVMRPGLHVTGRVVDTDGVPQPNVTVTLDLDKARHRDPGRPAFEANWREQVVSGNDGSFAISTWLVPGTYQVRVEKLQRVSPEWVDLDVGPGASQVVVVVRQLADAPTITGRVVDETGAPVCGAVVIDRSMAFSSAKSANTDGTFELHQTRDSTGEFANLVVSDDAYETGSQTPRKIAWGTRDVEFRITRGGTLTVRVVDAHNHPVEDYRVRLIPRGRDGWGSDYDRVRCPGRHTDGITVVAGVPRGDYLLVVNFAAPSVLEPLLEPLRQASNGPMRIDLRAGAPARRTVRVLDGDDRPVVGTKVQLCETFGQPFDDTNLALELEQWLCRSTESLVRFEGETDADGRVNLRGPGGREFGVCVLGPGHAPLRQAGVRLDVGDELVLHVSRGARFVGKIVPPEAVAELHRLASGDAKRPFVADRRPSLQLVRDHGRQRFPDVRDGEVDRRTLYFAEDGSIDASGLPAGTWQAQVEGCIADENEDAGVRFFDAGTLTFVDNQVTRQELDLQAILPGTVDGLVLANGEPLADQPIKLRNEQGVVDLTTDAAGRFTHEFVPGDYELLVSRSSHVDPESWTLLRCPTQAHVVRGQTSQLTFALACGKLRVAVHNGDGKPVANVEVQVLSGAHAEPNYLPVTDDAGRALAEFTAETVTLRVLPKALTDPVTQQQLWVDAQAASIDDALAAHWITLTSVTIVQGETKTLELHLPADAGY